MTDFLAILSDSEDQLLASVMRHAEGRTRYLAAVEAVWHLSFRGLTDTLRKAVAAGALLAPDPTLDDLGDPMVEFGRLEAKRHRERGISLEMFIGLMKLFRAAYLEVLRGQLRQETGLASAVEQILRFFDRIEISFCLAWVREAEAGNVKGLEERNLELVTERDRFVAIFESIPMPILLLDPDLSVRNMNHAAYRLFVGSGAPGAWYYNPGQLAAEPLLSALFPGFFKELESFQEQTEGRWERDWSAERDGVPMAFRVVLARMLDLPRPFAGILVTFDDQTERVNAARERERMLAEVRSLSSLLPICAWCKKVRNDQGYWDQLEGYLGTHAGILFSHGVCPDCAAKVRSEQAGQS